MAVFNNLCQVCEEEPEEAMFPWLLSQLQLGLLRAAAFVDKSYQTLQEEKLFSS